MICNSLLFSHAYYWSDIRHFQYICVRFYSFIIVLRIFTWNTRVRVLDKQVNDKRLEEKRDERKQKSINKMKKQLACSPECTNMMNNILTYYSCHHLFDLEIIHTFILALLFYFKLHWFYARWLIMAGSSSYRLLLCLPDDISLCMYASSNERMKAGRVMSVYSITFL